VSHILKVAEYNGDKIKVLRSTSRDLYPTGNSNMATQTGSTYISGTTTDSDEIPTNSSAIAERPRDARVTSIRKIVDF